MSGIQVSRWTVAGVIVLAVAGGWLLNAWWSGRPAATSTRVGCTIKGNINSQGEKIYHMPGQRFYGATQPEKWFCTEDEARRAGFRRSKV